jgi:hypothetical protein
VTVCSAYGCRHKPPFTFTHYDIATLTTVMASNRSHTGSDERKAIAKAIAWIENRVESRNRDLEGPRRHRLFGGRRSLTNGLRRRSDE